MARLTFTSAMTPSASCSCIEGNPCAVKYNCKDWANRYEVARKVRQNKSFTGSGFSMG